MLGVRRASITIAARELKLEGLIDYIRGHIRILDSKALDQILEFKVGSIQWILDLDQGKAIDLVLVNIEFFSYFLIYVR